MRCRYEVLHLHLKVQNVKSSDLGQSVEACFCECDKINRDYIKTGMHTLKKNLAATSNCRRQKGDTKQVPHWGSANIRRHRTKLNRHDELALGICAPLNKRCPTIRRQSVPNERFFYKAFFVIYYYYYYYQLLTFTLQQREMYDFFLQTEGLMPSTRQHPISVIQENFISVHYIP
jgi:hypothetical protein